MKRRVMIAKALSHEPRILFLDEPTAGVDVELRRDMWDMVRRLREAGVTIFLTTHYIEEAEQMADRIGIMNGGRVLLVEDKADLMNKLGTSQLTVTLKRPMSAIPAELSSFKLGMTEDGAALLFSYDARTEDSGIAALMRQLDASGIGVKTVHTYQSSLEEIFVDLVHTSGQP